MIETNKIHSALYALNTVLILAREMAYDNAPANEIADVLDVAEYLPRLLAEEEDRTAAFRDYLVLLTSKQPRFQLAVQRFDQGAPSNW